MKQQHTITTLPPSPEDERRARMIKYTVMMSIRVGCIVAMLFVQGWWLAVFAAGAVFLPYFAVVIANNAGGRGTAVERPGAIVPVAAGAAGGAGAGAPLDGDASRSSEASGASDASGPDHSEDER